MQQNLQPIIKDLVLMGGGHSHAIALRMFGMKPLPGVRLTLITEASDTPYSGMLPGHVAGFYDHEDCHIDLRSLAQFAQAQFYVDRVTGLDLENHQVLCEHRPPVIFDLLSIDIGSTPKLPDVPGIAEAVIPAKPVRQFLAKWEWLYDRVARSPQQSISLAIVGGGTGGVELSLNMQRRIHQILAAAQQPFSNLQIHLFHRGAEVMPNHNVWVRRRLHQILSDRGIQLHLNEKVQEVQPGIRGESGLTIACDAIFWVTQASAPAWLRAAGLAVDADGFIQVHDTLQSVSHPNIFAAGDIASMVRQPRPKAGVFAVRQGKPLYQNLRRRLLGQPLHPYRAQKDYLSLIGTGDRSAIASRGSFGWQSPLLWRWKDQIDRKFMERFNNLPSMQEGEQPSASSYQQSGKSHSSYPAVMHCAGCGSKVGSATLEGVLQRIRREQPDDPTDVLIGLDAPDDAAVVQVPAGKVLVQTIDYFRSLVNDPFVFGQISTHHCLSDLFAMGAEPQSALAIATIPYALEAKQAETLYQLLSGAIKVLHQAKAVLIGGHTTEDTNLAFGLSCNGLARFDQLLRKSGAKPGQVLILTKAIGTGTLFAAEMQRQAKGCWIDDAIESMLKSNQAAASCFLNHQATACTDITGFGLLGHLIEMIQASSVAVKLDLEAIPILAGARETTQMQIVSSLQPQNLRVSQYIDNLAEVNQHPNYSLLFDPQTSGGLLASVAEAQASACVLSLKLLGYEHAAVIGRILDQKLGDQPITIALK